MKHKREATNGQLGPALYFPVISSPSRGGGSGTDGSPSRFLVLSALNPTTDLYLVPRETKKLLHAGGRRRTQAGSVRSTEIIEVRATN